ncbi:MAG: hypothetical protein RR276_02025 [Angelakisella sp.]
MPKKASIGANIVLDGEKEYKEALKSINTELRVQDSEMKLTAAQYEKNDKSMQAVTARSRVLREEIRLKTQKVAELEKALDNAQKEYGETSKQSQEWQKSLNYAKADLIKTTSALKDNEKSMGSFTETIKGSKKELTALAAVVGGIVAGLAKMTVDTAKTADEILTLSSTTGISTEELQKMRYAEGLLDVSQNTMSDSMTKLTRNMDAARNGTKAQEDAFKKLRVQYKDGKELRDVNEVFYDSIDALGRVKNETERDALAMQLFGKSAKELNPLIEQGSKRLRELGVEAENMGYVMSTDTLDAFGALDDAMERFDKQGETLKNSLALAMLPLLTALFETIGKIPVPVLQMIVVITGLVAIVITMAKAIKSLTGTASSIQSFFKDTNPAALKTTAIIMGVVAALIALAAIIAVIIGKKDDLNETMDSIGNTIGNIKVPTPRIQTERIPTHAKGTAFHPGGLAIVGEQGPELVDLPRGSKVYPNGSFGGNTYVTNHNRIDAGNLQEVQAMIKILNGERRTIRQGYVGG